MIVDDGDDVQPTSTRAAPQVAFDVLEACGRFELERLGVLLRDALLEGLSVEHFAAVLRETHLRSIPGLKHGCMRFALHHFDELIERPEVFVSPLQEPFGTSGGPLVPVTKAMMGHFVLRDFLVCRVYADVRQSGRLIAIVVCLGRRLLRRRDRGAPEFRASVCLCSSEPRLGFAGGGLPCARSSCGRCEAGGSIPRTIAPGQIAPRER